MRYLKSVFTKNQIKVLISGFISLVLGLILVLTGIKVSSKLDSQNLASRWSSDNDYSQISAFMSELAYLDEDSILQLNYNIENRLDNDSIVKKAQNSRLWVYAYSAKGEATIASKNASATLTAYGVGGDFFLFHPYKLLSGNYFNSDFVMQDMVIIDRGTAWTLFGSNDVVGQYVTVGGVDHIIAGVVDLEDSRLNEAAGNTGATIFMSYESLSQYGNITYINCYEALLPNPISGYAINLVKDNMPVSKDRVEIIENSERYNWVNLLKVVKQFGTRSMTTKSIVFPYWENIARGIEDYLAPLVIFAMIFLLYPAIILLVLIIRMWKKRTIHINDLKEWIENIIERQRYKKAHRPERKKNEKKQ